MEPRFAQLPRALAERATHENLGDGVPALIATPEGDGPVPFVLWMHGRTVSKELDPGRYLRWVRTGIGAVALDLPGHGERFEPGAHSAEQTPGVVARMVGEIDGVLASIRERFPRLDTGRAAIGGMSAGGMATLRRLCDPHPFIAAAVEGTTGDLAALYFPEDAGSARPWPVPHDRAAVEAIDTSRHLAGFRPIPLLALHNEGDRMVPFQVQRAFLDRLRDHYRAKDADPDLIRLHTFSETGAPEEHAGFGRHANDAKNIQLAFLESVLLGERT
ncbi:MAG: prolyl oligopeptidase family serine peptidase [Phycisphaerales bacterium]|nr:prolyl oligopeptidase family serine peptidase [Planctomycetota bacterium]MCH8507611.1 prolyl oligopeptidase family serine peptidase [Phycisphaerales bacterium]